MLTVYCTYRLTRDIIVPCDASQISVELCESSSWLIHSQQRDQAMRNTYNHSQMTILVVSDKIAQCPLLSTQFKVYFVKIISRSTSKMVLIICPQHRFKLRDGNMYTRSLPRSKVTICIMPSAPIGLIDFLIKHFSPCCNHPRMLRSPASRKRWTRWRMTCPSAGIKVKWAQNKLKTELESHKVLYLQIVSWEPEGCYCSSQMFRWEL